MGIAFASRGCEGHLNMKMIGRVDNALRKRPLLLPLILALLATLFAILAMVEVFP
jgi:hypothetical protein